MKSLKSGLRIWIASASLIGFLGSWGLLAHAAKPVPFENANPPAITAPAPPPTLQPLPSLNSPSINLQPLPPLPRTQRSQPFLRTMGS
ncbi:MAG: hypothetical protein P8X95_08785 [Anaerolineales bacterium]|jgi:hypothetical protein